MNQYYWKQAVWFIAHVDGAVVEWLATVKQVSSPGRSEKAPGWLNAKLLAVLRDARWRAVQWGFNAAYHGSGAARRSLFTLAFSQRTVTAAQRAGVELRQAAGSVTAERAKSRARLIGRRSDDR